LDISLSAQIKQLIPNFKIGFIHYQGMEVMDTPQMIKGRMRLFQESIFFDLEDNNVTDIPSVKEWREIFKKTVKIQIAIAIQQKACLDASKNKIT